MYMGKLQVREFICIDPFLVGMQSVISVGMQRLAGMNIRLPQYHFLRLSCAGCKALSPAMSKSQSSRSRSRHASATTPYEIGSNSAHTAGLSSQRPSTHPCPIILTITAKCSLKGRDPKSTRRATIRNRFQKGFDDQQLQSIPESPLPSSISGMEGKERSDANNAGMSYIAWIYYA
jgi:hypothetical protein